MRAMMSSIRTADMDGNWYDYAAMIGAQAERGLWAEREARAILAETEPAVDGPDAYARAAWGWQGVYCLPGSMASALAESLAAFIAEPVQ